MIPKSKLDDWAQYIKSEGRKIGISEKVLDQITLETASNIRFTFPSHTSQLELIRRITKRVASSSPHLTEDDLEDIGLAIDEACTNVITHSYKGDTKGIIQVEINLSLHNITITLTDKGEEGQIFNPEILSPPDKEEYFKRLTKGGLGVYLIRKIMDEVKYTVSPGISNCLTMVKYIRPKKK